MIGSAGTTSVLSEEELRQVTGGHSHGRGELPEQLTTRSDCSEGPVPAQTLACWLPEDDGRSCDDDDDNGKGEACVQEHEEEVLVICRPDPGGLPEVDPLPPDDHPSGDMGIETGLPEANELGLPEMINLGGDGDDVVSSSEATTLPEQDGEHVFTPTPPATGRVSVASVQPR